MDPEHLIQPLTDEWVHRHQHFWSLLFRFGLISIFVLAVPWLAPAVREELSELTWIFPALSLIVTTISAWFINEEWQRAGSTYTKIKELRGEHDPEYTRRREVGASPRIGGFIIVLYVVTLWTLAILAIVVMMG